MVTLKHYDEILHLSIIILNDASLTGSSYVKYSSFCNCPVPSSVDTNWRNLITGYPQDLFNMATNDKSASYCRPGKKEAGERSREMNAIMYSIFKIIVNILLLLYNQKFSSRFHRAV